MAITVSQIITPPKFIGNHKFVFYLCDSISVL